MNLSKVFPSLLDPLSSSRILGLYFASSWCPDCKPTTPMIKELYEKQNDDKKFAVMYISSDRSEEEMLRSMKESHSSWGCIPFDSTERNELKKLFGCCAMSEVRELGLSPGKSSNEDVVVDIGERKFGIPTLIVIDSKTEEVLSFKGIDEIANGSFLQKYEL